MHAAAASSLRATAPALVPWQRMWQWLVCSGLCALWCAADSMWPLSSERICAGLYRVLGIGSDDTAAARVVPSLGASHVGLPAPLAVCMHVQSQACCRGGRAIAMHGCSCWATLTAAATHSACRGPVQGRWQCKVCAVSSAWRHGRLHVGCRALCWFGRVSGPLYPLQAAGLV